MRKVYLDNAATTALSPRVLEAMLPYFTQYYGNPSSVHAFGREAKQGLDKARDQVAKALHCDPSEVIFTGCGTESDNTVLLGVAQRYGNKGKHIITTNVEHHAILHTCEYLEKQGYEVTYLPVDQDGLVTAEQVAAAIRPDTILVSIMFANNEVGTIMPIQEIGAVCKEKGVLFHTDAVQAVGHIPVDVQAMHIDMLSMSGHKFHGPKGIGVLYARKGVPIFPLIHGGAQERNRRGGTENIPAIVGMASALDEACDHLDEDTRKLTALRERLIAGLSKIPHSVLNGHREHRLPGTVNFCFEGIEGESLLLLLDDKGVYASSGSACTSGSLDPSHVLLAIGRPHEIAHGSLRLSLSPDTTEEEVDYMVKAVTDVVVYLRSISPVWRNLEAGIQEFIIQ